MRTHVSTRVTSSAESLCTPSSFYSTLSLLRERIAKESSVRWGVAVQVAAEVVDRVAEQEQGLNAGQKVVTDRIPASLPVHAQADTQHHLDLH